MSKGGKKNPPKPLVAEYVEAEEIGFTEEIPIFEEAAPEIKLKITSRKDGKPQRITTFEGSKSQKATISSAPKPAAAQRAEGVVDSFEEIRRQKRRTLKRMRAVKGKSFIYQQDAGIDSQHSPESSPASPSRLEEARAELKKLARTRSHSLDSMSSEEAFRDEPTPADKPMPTKKTLKQTIERFANKIFRRAQTGSKKPKAEKKISYTNPMRVGKSSDKSSRPKEEVSTFNPVYSTVVRAKKGRGGSGRGA